MEKLNTDQGLSFELEETASARSHVVEPCYDCGCDPALKPEHAAEVARAISSLRFNQAFRAAIMWGNKHHFHDNSEYFVENIGRLAEQAVRHSTPTNADLLRTHVTTTGIHQRVLTYKGSRYCLVDVGGRRSERKKWIYALEDVRTVIYPVETIGYERSLHEDEDGDRMREHFMLFESLSNSHWFAKSNMVVIFTKIDLLEKYMRGYDVDAFLRKSNVISANQPRVTAADKYLEHLEEHFKGLIRSADVRKRTRFIRANLVDVDEHNPAIDIFNTLESFTGVSAAANSV
jgi:guanine nucleotide-binding protein subunit alpha